jgi:hypothetical protein
MLSGVYNDIQADAGVPLESAADQTDTRCAREAYPPPVGFNFF